MADLDDDIIDDTKKAGDDDLLNSSKKKILRGAYEVSYENQVYSEEKFEVYRDPKNLHLDFRCSVNTRVSTGELFIVEVNYTCTSEYQPREVTVKKSLGTNRVIETYSVDHLRNVVEYKFKDEETEEEHTSILMVPPKIHIATPSLACNFSFIKSRKVENNSRVIFYVVQSFNKWEFENELAGSNIVAEKVPQTGGDFVYVDGNKLKGTEYRLFRDKTGDELEMEMQKEDADKAVTVYLSKYLSVPYQVEEGKKYTAKVKYLNDLE